MTQKPRYVAAKQGVVHVKAKLEMVNKAHSNAQRAADAHENNVVTLKQQLKYGIMVFCRKLDLFKLTLSVIVGHCYLGTLRKRNKNVKRNLLLSRKNWQCN